MHEGQVLIHTDKVSFSSRNSCYLTRMRPSQILTFLDNVLQAGISKAEISHSRACSDILPGKNSWDFPRSRNKYSYIMTPKTKGRKTTFAAGIDLAGRHDDCFNRVDTMTASTGKMLFQTTLVIRHNQGVHRKCVEI